MKPSLMQWVLAALVAGATAACAPNMSPDSYAAGAVGQVNRTVRGVVVSARPVAIGGTQSGLGAGAGAVAGGVAGSAIGGNARANVIGAVGGAVIGGIAGAMAEDAATRQSGMEYVVQTENGALLTVVQGASPVLAPNQKVLVIYGARSRVIPDPT
ncbi:outer membrane lipoprotein SlyB [Azospirillum fermentarium]|uniref:glycine zipper 2TM domain-containing protein n=1 Tax=Azospirillum fermentarium TaxID=1233114 RepID=UPI0022268A7F|nr:glycine zipper 2TM domain-containing protein [Azospirillum fermentarium]MCW2245741.1 outer membrane lipoprotein SlyB [Azospirillum fermentarium]